MRDRVRNIIDRIGVLMGKNKITTEDAYQLMSEVAKAGAAADAEIDMEIAQKVFAEHELSKIRQEQARGQRS